MDPATLLLIIQLITLVEREIPAAIILVKQIKAALKDDPQTQAVFDRLNADAMVTSAQAQAAIAAWHKANGV